MNENIDKYIAAFNEKSEYLLRRPFDIEFTEAYMEDFLFYVFERENGGFPFEESMSQEYQSWCQKKKEWNMRLMAWRKEHPNEPGGFNEKINYDDVSCFRYNPIAIEFYQNKKEETRARHSIILKDNPESYEFLDGRKFVIMSPITYVGRNRSADNGRYLYALAFDLDGVGLTQMDHLMKLMMIRNIDDEKVQVLPMANIIVNSGHGLHLYYLLKEPIPLYKRNRDLLNKLKRGLTQIIWTKLTSTVNQVQHQGIFQGFRIPGTQTKFGEIVRAFHNSDSNYHTIESLNSHMPPSNENRLSKEELTILSDSKYNPNGVTLKEAERRWPEWYERVVINGIKTPKKWHVKRDLYDWWLKRLWDTSENVEAGHRYFCLMALAVYAVKCDVDYEELKRDSMRLVDRMEKLTVHDDNHFTEMDAEDALEAYKVGYCTFPRNSIEYLTGLEMPVNRRNGRKQKIHLTIARATRDVLHPNGNWINKKGRTDNTLDTNASAWKIAHWRAWHLDGTKMQCHRETGIARSTIDRWWRGIDLLMDISPYTRIEGSRFMGWNMGDGTTLFENITVEDIKDLFKTYLGNVGPERKGKSR